MIKTRDGRTLEISNLKSNSLIYIEDYHVKKIFKIKNIEQYIKKNKMIENTDYQIEKSGKHIFTYHGILKIIFDSKQHTYWKKFSDSIKWNDLYFCKTSTNNINNEFKLICEESEKNKDSCIYLIELGKVMDIKQKFSSELFTNISDDDIVIKIGHTISHDTRESRHITNFDKLLNKKIKMDMHVYIHPLFLFDAESSILTFLNNDGNPLKIGNHKEIYTVTKDKLDILKIKYKEIEDNCSKRYVEFKQTVKSFEDNILYIKSKI